MLKNVLAKVLSCTSVFIAAAIGMGASPAFGQSCPKGETVNIQPPGESFRLNLAPGTQMTWLAGTMGVNCTSSSFQGWVPAAGKNVGDLVTMTTTEPDCPASACTTSDGLIVQSKGNSDNGSWGIKLGCGGSASLHIPKAGGNSTMGTCTMTLAPDKAVDIPATWTNGSPSVLAIDASIPVAGRGTGCPPFKTVRLKAKWVVSQVNDSAKTLTVSQVKAAK